MIETHGIVKRFGKVTAVEHATFAVPARSICGFLGPNGAGKTTTIRMLVGALAPDEGRMRIHGLDPETDGEAVRRSVGYLAEESPIYPELTVAEFIGHRARLYGLPRAGRAAAVARAIERCQLSEVQRRLCGQLSKGFRQRAGLAAALVHSPAVLVLDEPTSGLDPSQVGEFRKLLRDLSRESTVLLSSHVLAEVEAVCDRAVLIHRGRVAAEGTLAELRARGASAATLVLEVRGDAAGALEAALGGTAFEAAEMDSGWRRYEVRAAAESAETAERVAAAMAAAGLALRRLEWMQTSLEMVFHRVVAEGARA